MSGNPTTQDLKQILEGAVAHVRKVRKLDNKARQPPEHEQDAIPHRDALMSARSLFVMEVESNSRWTIRKVGQGVAELLGEATRESLHGKSLATLLRCHDVKQLHTMWPSTETHGVLSLSPNLSLIHI